MILINRIVFIGPFQNKIRQKILIQKIGFGWRIFWVNKFPEKSQKARKSQKVTHDFRQGWYSQESPSPFGLFFVFGNKIRQKILFHEIGFGWRIFLPFFHGNSLDPMDVFFPDLSRFFPDLSRFIQIFPEFQDPENKSKKRNFAKRFWSMKMFSAGEYFWNFFILMKIHGKFMENSWKIHD